MGDKVDNNKNNFWSSYKAELDSGYYRKIDGKECMKEELIVEYPNMIGVINEQKKIRTEISYPNFGSFMIMQDGYRIVCV